MTLVCRIRFLSQREWRLYSAKPFKHKRRGAATLLLFDALLLFSFNPRNVHQRPFSSQSNHSLDSTHFIYAATSNTTAHSEARLCSMLLTTSQATSRKRCGRCRDRCTGSAKTKSGRSIVRFCELRRLVGLLLIGALLVSRLGRLGRHNGVCILGPFAEQRHGSCKLGTIVPFGSAVFVGIPTIERPTIDRLLLISSIGGTNFKVASASGRTALSGASPTYW